MTYHIKVKNGNKNEIREVEGVRELHDTLSFLRGQGLRVSTIRRIMVR